MNITFDPLKLPEGNPFAPFYDNEDLKKALRNVKKNTEEVRFKKGETYSIYCHWDGYPEGVGVALVNNFRDEDAVIPEDDLRAGGVVLVRKGRRKLAVARAN